MWFSQACVATTWLFDWTLSVIDDGIYLFISSCRTKTINSFC